MPRLLFVTLLLSFSSLAQADSAATLMALVTDRDARIYDIAASPSAQFLVAVGEDDSERTRKLQMMDEHHESVILVSTDGGKSWTRSSGGGDSIPLDSVIVLDEKRAVVSGAIEGAGGVILRTNNSGADWSSVYTGGMVFDLARDGERSLWAAGYGLLHSVDGGKNWKEVEVPGGFYYAIHAVDGKTLVTVGDSGVMTSHDGGLDWSNVPLPGGGANDSCEIRQAGDELGIFCGDELLLTSDSGGRSWSK